MGLDTTHNAFHGAYSSFMRFRRTLVIEACAGTFSDNPMEYRWTFEASRVPLALRTGLLTLMNHSDCEGELSPEECTEVATFLEWADAYLKVDCTKQQAAQFALGCRDAASKGETLEFH